MKNPLTIMLSALAGVIIIALVGYRNVPTVKTNSEREWKRLGFNIVGYEGYTFDPIHGGQVWYIVQRTGNSNTLYHAGLAKWFEEYHLYSLKAIDVKGVTE